MRVLGFDIGTTSVGWALVDMPSAGGGQGSRIIGMGVRIFPESREPASGGAKLEPLNKQRRAMRMLRRQLRRRRRRRQELNETLTRMGLLPKFGTAQWAKLMGCEKGLKSTDKDPYFLRKKGMTEALSLFEFGRALYHIAKHRGFKARPKAQEAMETTDDDVADDDTEARKKEEGKVEGAIGELKARMGKTTLGTFLSSLPDGERKRGRYLGRDMIDDEFQRLWDEQAKHHPEILTKARFHELHEIAFRQRPVFWRLATLGECHLVPGAPLAFQSSWLGQHFRMLQMLNSLRLAGGNARPLSAAERDKVRAWLDRKKDITWTQLRKLLKLPKTQKFNFEIGGERRLLGNGFEARMAEALGDDWEILPARDTIRQDLVERLWRADYRVIGNRRVEIRTDEEADKARAELAARWPAEWGITPEQALALSRLRLPAQRMRHSAKALEILRGPLEQGFLGEKPITYGDLLLHDDWAVWRKKHLPHRIQHTGEIPDRLPSHPRAMGDIRNPTVSRCLNEVRKVTNNLVAAHGLPDLVRVELTREVQLPRLKRIEMMNKNRDREKERKSAAGEIEKQLGKQASGRDIEKYLLWLECGKFCPYTGKAIGFDDLFRATKFDIEHIFPRSRTLDNSFGNKTLCDTDFNKNEKRNQTIWEAKGADTTWWEDFETRLANSALAKNNPAKARRLSKRGFHGMEEEGFSERQLTDTGYAARLSRDFLKRLFPDTPADARRVETRSGRLTSRLRHLWGLDTILNASGTGKSRDDHRHHAVDALTVACATQSHVKALSDWYQAKDAGRPEPEFPHPWDSIHADAAAAVAAIVVSHKVRRKVSGALHAQTSYGDTGESETTGRATYRYFVTRKRLEDLSKSMLDDIRDDTLRKLVKDHVASRSGDPKKSFPPYPTLPTPDGIGRPIKKVRVVIKQQPDLMVPLNARTQAFADAGNNHHMSIYRLADDSIDFEVVSLFEASRRLSAREPVVRRTRSDGGTFIMSLMPGDVLEFPEANNGNTYRTVEGVWASGQVVLADNARADGSIWSRPNPNSLLGRDARKVSVDPIGRVRPAHD